MTKRGKEGGRAGGKCIFVSFLFQVFVKIVIKKVFVSRNLRQMMLR